MSRLTAGINARLTRAPARATIGPSAGLGSFPKSGLPNRLPGVLHWEQVTWEVIGLFHIPRTEEEWLEASASVRFERDETFRLMRVMHPLQARFHAAFCKYWDSGFVAFQQGHTDTAERCGAALKGLTSWLSDQDSSTHETPQQAFKRLFREGYPLDLIIDYIVSPKKRGRGHPVSNRWPVLLAYEERLKNPELSWMQLAIKYCQCSKAKHDEKCRAKLRQQARLLERVMRRWGV